MFCTGDDGIDMEITVADITLLPLLRIIRDGKALFSTQMDIGVIIETGAGRKIPKCAPRRNIIQRQREFVDQTYQNIVQILGRVESIRFR